MTTLTAFLLDRITEDEAVAQAPDPSASPEVLTDMSRIEYDYGPVGYARLGIGRVLAECQAKRRIVELATAVDEAMDPPTTLVLADDALLALAQVYADHPDFDPAWVVE